MEETFNWTAPTEETYEARGGMRTVRVSKCTFKYAQNVGLPSVQCRKEETIDPKTGEVTNLVFKTKGGKFTFKSEDSLKHHLRGRI